MSRQLGLDFSGLISSVGIFYRSTSSINQLLLILGAVDFIFFFGSGRLFVLFDDLISLIGGQFEIDMVVFVGSFVQLALIIYAVTLVVMHFQNTSERVNVMTKALKETHPCMVTVIVPKYLLTDPIPDPGINLGFGYERFIGEPKTESEYYKQFPDIEEIMKDINKVTELYAKHHPNESTTATVTPKNETVTMYEILNGPSAGDVETAEQFEKLFIHQQPLVSK